MKAEFKYEKWWHRFIPKYRHEKEAAEQIANFILKKHKKQIEKKVLDYVKEVLVYGRTSKP